MSTADAKKTVSQEQFSQTTASFPVYAINYTSYWHQTSKNGLS